MSFVPTPAIELDKTAFGELAVAEPTPLFQVYAVNGIREDTITSIKGTGTVTAADSNFVIQSGTGSTNITRLTSKSNATYRSGQGLLGRFTAFFESNAADSIQIAGLISEDAGFVFGYNGTEFGIARVYDGAVESQDLQITTPSTGSENATVTVDGTPYTVPITNGTVQHNAYEIATYLDANVPNYSVSSNNDTVTAISEFAIAAGSFAFTSGTAVASWTQVSTGAVPTYDWVPESGWSNPPNWTIDPSKGNVFQIKIQYLGYGGIRFYVESPLTSEFELVHIYDYANQNIVPTVKDPTFKVGWCALNDGNTSNLIIRGATAAAFNEGKAFLDERARALSDTITGVNTTRTNLITIRSRLEFNGKTNRIDIRPVLLIVSAEHNKTVSFHLQINETTSGDMLYQFLDSAESVVEYATNSATMNGDGRDIGEFRVRGTDTLQVDISRLSEYVLPGESLTLSVNTDTGTGAEADYSIIFREDQ
jgi:hypothetical protein